MVNERSGLQIALRCVLCSSMPTSASPLFEMQNHFYICQYCLFKEKQRGKSLKGVDGVDITLTAPILSSIDAQPKAGIKEERAASSGKDIFRVLDISYDATAEEALQAVSKQMRFWTRQERSDERERMRELLRSLQNEMIANPQFLETQRQHLHRATVPLTSTLTVVDREIAIIQEFVDACERSVQGWQDGEMHLRSGELEHWVHPLTQDLALARLVAASADSPLSNFHALNSVLYQLWPERPFRLYQRDQWQSLHVVQSIPTLKELAALCDKNWALIKLHLYHGCLLTWLEYVQHCQGIGQWYSSTILHYAQRGPIYQSLGLELLLEHIVPELRRPVLLLKFDGTHGSYTLSDWDKEIAHQPIEVVLHNATRGATIISVALETGAGDPDWLTLAKPQPALMHTVQRASDGHELSPLYNRPGEQNPVRFNICLQNLQQMGHGKTFYGQLHVSQYTAVQQTVVTHKYPLTLSTIAYKQGFRRWLWRWGLRGGLPGLTVNFLASAAFCLIFYLLTMTFVQVPSLASHDFLSITLLAGIVGIRNMLFSFLNVKLFLFAGALAGVIGSLIGWRKGHADYSSQQSAHDWHKASLWCSLVSTCLLLYISWSSGVSSLFGQVLDDSRLRFAQITGCIFAGLLMYLSISVLGLARLLVERLLRQHYNGLLKPQGSMT